MAELDYAFLAEYAKVETNGSLTAVGASYTHIAVPAFPAQHLLSVGGRVRTDVGAGALAMRLTTVFGSAYRISYDFALEESPNFRPYDGKVGRLFALTTLTPLPAAGLYEVLLEIAGQQVRRLAFDAEQGPSGP